MSIKTEIDRIISAVTAAHKKVEKKGGTTSQPYLIGNLESAIDSIPESGGGSVGTCTVTISFTGNAEGFGEFSGTKYLYIKNVEGEIQWIESTFSSDITILYDVPLGGLIVTGEDLVSLFSLNLTSTIKITHEDSSNIMPYGRTFFIPTATNAIISCS